MNWKTLFATGATCLILTFQAAAQTCVTPPSGLVSWWPGEDTADDIFGSNTGTEQGGISYGTGKVGKAFSLDGVDDLVEVAHSPSLNLEQFTIDAWIKHDTQDTNEFHGIVSKNPTDNVNRTYLLSVDRDSPPNIHFSVHTTTTPAADLFSSGTIPDDVWTHVAASYDGNFMRIYINGAPDGVMALSGTPLTNTAPLRIGHTGFFGASQYFKGLIDEVELFNRALSAAEIEAIFNADGEGKCKGVSDPDNDAPDEIDVISATLSQFDNDVSCALVINSGSGGLASKSNFNCHIDFDDEESEAAAGKGGRGCDSDVGVVEGDGDFEDIYRLGENGVCTTSDLTMAFRTGRRGGSCTGLPSIICSEEEMDADGDTDNGCDGDVGGDDAVSCKITLTGDVEDIADSWDAQCEDGDDECLTTVTDKSGDGEFEVLVFWDTHFKKDRDRVPDTDDNQKPNDVSEVEIATLVDTTP